MTMTEEKIGCQPPNLFVGKNKFFPEFQAPRFICGENPKSKIQNPKSK
jgi:hypothetical protein